ncbi:MAG: hypothetical protein QHG99_00655 [Methanomicrobiales archaeon]|nr:hypothetical protein [Methanomicrobiales archaeon]
MRDPVILAGLLLLVMAGIAGALLLMDAGSEGHVSIGRFSTDREIYQSGEEMEIRVTILSPRRMENLVLKIEGIVDLRGIPRCRIEESVTLNEGSQTFAYRYELPECSVCAGLPPGDYRLNATLSEGERVLSSVGRRIRLE